jgi:rubrerythrin
MRYKIDCYDKALKVLEGLKVLFGSVEPHAIVWDIVDSLDSLDYHDVPVSIYQCRKCGTTEVHYPYELISSECPWCDDTTIEVAVEVEMIVQENAVMYRKGDK